MFSEIIQLNKVFKCNSFTNIKPYVFKDGVIYKTQSPETLKNGTIKVPKLACLLHRVDEAEMDIEGILDYFGVPPKVKEKSEEWFLERMREVKGSN